LVQFDGEGFSESFQKGLLLGPEGGGALIFGFEGLTHGSSFLQNVLLFGDSSILASELEDVAAGLIDAGLVGLDDFLESLDFTLVGVHVLFELGHSGREGVSVFNLLSLEHSEFTNSSSLQVVQKLKHFSSGGVFDADLSKVTNLVVLSHSDHDGHSLNGWGSL